MQHSAERPSLLITGGSGLLALNWALSVRDRYAVALAIHERAISLERTRTLRIDLESVDDIVRAIESIQPEFLIHTAGLTNVEKCEAEPELARHVNVELAANVARACARTGLRLVCISTDHLFSGEAPLLHEREPVAPRNVYGMTKAESEVRVLDGGSRNLVMRTNFYGWGPSYRRSFSDVIIDALRSRRKLNLFEDVFYTPILMEAAAQAVHDLVDRDASGIFHVVGDERVSKYEFGCKLAKRFDLDTSLISPGSITDRASLVRRPRDMSLSNLKARNLLGRKLGGIDEQLARLQQQERNGFAREMQKL